MKTIVLLQPRYPYGKSQTYMGGALMTVGAQLIEAGYRVDFYDLNLDTLASCKHALERASFIGITVIGAPYIPSVIKLAQDLAHLKAPILIGGQVIAKLGAQEFNALFTGTNAVQIKHEHDLATAVRVKSIAPAFSLSLIPMWKMLPEKVLGAYLQHEMTLVFSQGCHFQCAFCAAEKRQREMFKDVRKLESDLRFLALRARKNGLNKLEFYATSLDFFQNPNELRLRLYMIARVQRETGIRIKIRCLACMTSFMKALEQIPNLESLLKGAGVWCIGFGVDGLDSLVWRAQKKVQNKTLEQVWECLNIAERMGIQVESLLVMGFPQETFGMMFKYLQFALQASVKHKNIVLRPYLAKPQVPGNDHWGPDDPNRLFVREPARFANLDFCALGSQDTDKSWSHRFFANTIFFLICGIFGPLGKCSTSPLLPVGRNMVWNLFAKWWNKTVPFDR